MLGEPPAPDHHAIPDHHPHLPGELDRPSSVQRWACGPHTPGLFFFLARSPAPSRSVALTDRCSTRLLKIESHVGVNAFKLGFSGLN